MFQCNPSVRPSVKRTGVLGNRATCSRLSRPASRRPRTTRPLVAPRSTAARAGGSAPRRGPVEGGGGGRVGGSAPRRGPVEGGGGRRVGGSAPRRGPVEGGGGRRVGRCPRPPVSDAFIGVTAGRPPPPRRRPGRAGPWCARSRRRTRSEEHTSELQSRENHVCRPMLEKK